MFLPLLSAMEEKDGEFRTRAFDHGSWILMCAATQRPPTELVPRRSQRSGRRDLTRAHVTPTELCFFART